jgi:isoleucyl-tRNA synthetase
MYRKLRNTLRFMLANISDFDPAQAVPLPQMEGLDRWVLCRLGDLVEKVTLDYEEYAFHRAVKRVHEFCTIELSNFYLDAIKDPLYTFHPDDPKRRSAQSALHKMAETLIALVAPILPMTAEEAWGALTGARHQPSAGARHRFEESVHLQRWPDRAALPKDPILEESWQRLLELRDQAMKALEEARGRNEIGDALEAQMEVTVRDEKLWDFLAARREELAAACIVSELNLVKGADSGPAVSFGVRKAAGAKCQRCWMRLATVGANTEHPGLCHRCVDVVKKLV